jgi:outer membrane protein
MMKGLKKAHGLMAIVVAVSLILLGVSASVCAQEGESPWMVRVLGLAVVLDDESETIPVIEGEAEVDDAITADLGISYFFTNNIAAELTLAVTNHDVEAKDTALGDADLADVWLPIPHSLASRF